jgi:hypothetical protein
MSIFLGNICGANAALELQYANTEVRIREIFLHQAKLHANEVSSLSEWSGLLHYGRGSSCELQGRTTIGEVTARSRGALRSTTHGERAGESDEKLTSP